MNQLKHSYRMRHPTAKKFALLLKREINRLIRKNKISLSMPVNYRVKSWKSIYENAQRSKYNGISDVIDLSDFIGLRVVLLYRRDIEKVCHILKSKFNILDSDDKSERLDPNQFGYQSIHLDLKIFEPRLPISPLENFIGYSAEVQVRTTAQHIWAEVSHDLQYKSEDGVPKTIRRSINRMAALLELVDLEFERTLNELDKYDKLPIESQSNDQLNVELIKKILNRMLPRKNRSDYEHYHQISLEISNRSAVQTVKQLKSFVEDKLKYALEVEKELINKFRNDGTENDGTVTIKIDNDSRTISSKNLKRGVYFSHYGLVMQMLLGS